MKKKKPARKRESPNAGLALLASLRATPYPHWRERCFQRFHALTMRAAQEDDKALAAKIDEALAWMETPDDPRADAVSDK